MNGKQKTEVAKLEVKSFEAQDIFPGVYSNLKKTRTYILKASGEFSTSAVVAFLVVDSIKIPVRFVSVDGAKLGSPKDPVSGKFTELVVHAARNYYNDEAPQVVEADAYPKVDFDTEGKSFLEITSDLGVQYVELPEVVQLDPVYAP